jgi:hypothetical protein
MDMLKFFVIIIFSLLISFGLWYLIFAFVSGQWNPLEWHWIARLAYLWIALSAATSVSEGMTNKFL